MADSGNSDLLIYRYKIGSDVKFNGKSVTSLAGQQQVHFSSRSASLATGRLVSLPLARESREREVNESKPVVHVSISMCAFR